MITYTLNVTQMDVAPQAEGQTDVVINVHWAYVGTDGTNSGSFGGTTPVFYQQGAPFVPYDQLTEAEVTAWVLASWTKEQGDMIQQAVDAQIAVQTPPLPWAATPVANP